MSAIVFLDTETTGLSINDDIWELAAIRHEDGKDTWYHWFVRHRPEACGNLPSSFRSDHRARFPGNCVSSNEAVSPQELAVLLVHTVFVGKPIIVGAVPNFDTERISSLLRTNGYHEDYWHYHLCDVENLAVGYLRGIGVGAPWPYSDSAAVMLEAVQEGVCEPPWDSERLSRAVGVEPDDFERHTAMGDVLWARAIYDQIAPTPVIRATTPVDSVRSRSS